MNSRILLAAVAGVAVALATPALAQDAPIDPVAGTVFDGDYLTVGISGAYAPTYEGSDNYTLFPVPVVQGKVGSVAITPRAGGAALDFIDDPRGAKVNISLGPVVRLQRDRVSRIKDPVVRSLGKLDTAVNLGVNAGLTFNDLVTGYDSITIASDVTWDVAGAHKGMLITPSVSYFTPLSKGMAINLTVAAEHMDDDYANYYFTVSPAGRVASGLPTFQANSGWKSGTATALGAFDLDGDLTNGGLAIFALGGYTKLFNDAKETPLTSIRGDRDQWTAAVGVAYTF